MAKLTGTGAPGRNTQGALGDIYTDTSTGDRYKCTFAYRGKYDLLFDCTWAKLPKEKATKIEPVKQVEVETEAVVKESKVEEKEVVEEKPAKKSKRTNYTNYSKQGK